MTPNAFTTNPEFRRNLWLSFSTHRLIAMPALLGLTFLAIWLSERRTVADDLYFAADGLFIFIVWLWGARNANSTIVDELRDKTWDQQRMSALNPWTMTWGKLFGSTSFNWYGGIICLAVAVLSGIAAGKPSWLIDQLSLVAVGVMLHAALIALNLHTGQLEMKLIQRGGVGWLAVILVFTAFPLVNHILSDHIIGWWGMQFESSPFLLGSALLFAACATFAAWRVVSNALQVRTLPWAWPLFAGILAGYFAGFADSSSDRPLFMLAYTGLFIASAMTYAVLFTEPTGLLVWNKLRIRQQAGDWRGWLEHLPLWPTTLLLAFLCALLAMLAQPEPTRHDIALPFLNEPLNMALMLLRDAAIVLFFSFAPNARRAAGAAAIYLLVIDMLLPFLFKVAGLDMLSYFFLPTGSQYGTATNLMVMTTHAGIALGLVGWRLNSQRQSQPTSGN